MITITKYRALNGQGVKAFFSIKVEKWGNFFINDLKLVEKNGGRFISFPDQKYEKDGETKYKPYCGFETNEMKTKFQDQVMKAIDEYVAVTNPTEQGEIPF